jgi:hypothetical protein
LAEDLGNIAVLAFAPILIGALIAAGAAYFWTAGRELRANGVTTRATIVRKKQGTSLRGDYNQFTVQFTDTAGNARTVEVTERQMRSEGIREGAVVAITYDPARPEQAEFGYRWAKKLQGWIAVIFGLFGGGMMVYGLGLVLGVG